MNPFDIEVDRLEESKEVVDEKDLLKMKLVSEFLKVSSNMSSHEIISLTGLQESDLSRLRVMSIEQFSIDKIIEFVLKLGFSVKIDIGKNIL